MIGRVFNGLLYIKCHLESNGKMRINFNENLPNVIGPITKKYRVLLKFQALAFAIIIYGKNIELQQQK